MRNLLLAAAAAVAFTAMPASAATVVVGGGWTTFSFGGVGSALTKGGDSVFTFSVPRNAVLKITDAFLVGDIFKLTINGNVQANTSTPGSGPSLGSNYEGAFNSGYYSTGLYSLAAGNYSVSGIATASPFQSGGGALRVDLAGVPEPSTWAMLILGFGVIGGAMRSARRQSVRVTYA
jgi:PEP-CTERM motif